MVTTDMLQYKKKLTKPVLRVWSKNKNNIYYKEFKGTKTNFSKIMKDKANKNKFFVAFKGKEYKFNEFLKKFPKYKGV